MSQQACAEQLSTTQSNVSKWERGDYKPSPAQFIALARLAAGGLESLLFLKEGGVQEDFFHAASRNGTVPAVVAEGAVRDAERKRLAEFAASGAIADLEGAVTKVPLLRDSAAAGTPRAIDEKAIEQLIPVPTSWLPHGARLFALRVTGDSMEPILLDNHIVIVDVDSRDPKLLVNHMVAARGEDGVTIKWLREDNGDYMLVPQHVSVRHPVRRLRRGGEWSIVGRVVKWIGEPPPPPKKR